MHMCLSVPSKFSTAFAIGFLKGKSVARIHRQVLRNKRFTCLHFWSRGYCASTVGLDEATMRKYIRDQNKFKKPKIEIDFR